jgi:hypothetical protein
MTGLLRRRFKAFFLVSLMVGLVAAVACGGSEGAQGPQGVKGDTGATGAQGPQGPQGPAGQNGAAGAAGQDGEDGEDGADGANGSNAAVLVHDAANNVVGSVEFLTAGTSVFILGGGFEAGERISVTGIPRQFPVLLASATANDHGAFSATVRLPASFTVAPDSVFTVTAAGEDTGPVHGVFVLVDKVAGN